MSAGISDRDIAAEMQFHPAQTRAAAWQDAAAALAVRRVLLAEAARRGIEAHPGTGTVRETAEESQIRRLIEEAVAVPDVTDEDCRAEYAHQPERYRSPDLYEAAHILIAAGMTNAAARGRAREKAAGLLTLLVQSPDRFAALAHEFSDCPSGESGGALGQVSARDIAPELASMLAAMAPGTIAPIPVPSRHGYHVLRLDRKSEGRLLPYAAVEVRIRDALRARAWAAAAHAFITALLPPPPFPAPPVATPNQ